ncbi:hypothetical protein [Alloactinosynnema sp. L-07]|nr:hypothetical protein [Alloactinosynnema sp. L-07]
MNVAELSALRLRFRSARLYRRLWVPEADPGLTVDDTPGATGWLLGEMPSLLPRHVRAYHGV